MKIKFTIEHTPDVSDEVPTPKTTSFIMQSESDKDFPMHKISEGMLSLIQVLRGDRELFNYAPRSVVNQGPFEGPIGFGE